MSDNLTVLSLSDLKKISSNVIREIEKRTVQTKQSILKELKKLCAEAGIDISELFAGEKQEPVKVKKATKPQKAKKPVEPVYFHQADPTKTWSGRGRKPEWVDTWIKNGGNLEDLKKKPW